MNHMKVYPNAKINLGLNIVEKRSDGYHNIETIFYPVRGLQDKIEICEFSDSHLEYRFIADGIQIDGDLHSNLVIKAFKLLASEHNLAPTELSLVKQIPFGAGLGGGSADAAFTLTALNEYYQIGLSLEQLEEYAVKLGADCPVFIKNKPVYAEGIGNIFSSIELDLSEYQIVLVKPDIHVSTPEAYSLVKPKRPAIALREIIKMPVGEWREHMHNDFEASVFVRQPRIAQIKQELYNLGAIYASMSGSGSSVFGMFPKQLSAPTTLRSHFPNDFVFEGGM